MSSNSSGFRVRRSLSFAELPYRGKSFFLDIKAASVKSRTTERILDLGGQIETFLSKDISLLITDKDLENSQRTEDSPILTKQNKNVPLSRGQALLLKSSKQQTKSNNSCSNNNNDVVQCAANLGVKAQTAGMFIRTSTKHLAKLKTKKKSKQHDNDAMAGMSPLSWDKDKENMYIVKVEDVDQLYRPIFKQFETVPKIDYTGTASPFNVGVVLTKEKDNNNNQSKKKPAGGVLRGGYCESCDHWYKCTLREHLNSTKHVEFIASAENFKSLNEVSLALPNFSKFLQKNGLKCSKVSDAETVSDQTMHEERHHVSSERTDQSSNTFYKKEGKVVNPVIADQDFALDVNCSILVTKQDKPLCYTSDRNIYKENTSVSKNVLTNKDSSHSELKSADNNVNVSNNVVLNKDDISENNTYCQSFLGETGVHNQNKSEVTRKSCLSMSDKTNKSDNHTKTQHISEAFQTNTIYDSERSGRSRSDRNISIEDVLRDVLNDGSDEDMAGIDIEVERLNTFCNTTQTSLVQPEFMSHSNSITTADQNPMRQTIDYLDYNNSENTASVRMPSNMFSSLSAARCEMEPMNECNNVDSRCVPGPTIFSSSCSFGDNGVGNVISFLQSNTSDNSSMTRTHSRNGRVSVTSSRSACSLNDVKRRSYTPEIVPVSMENERNATSLNNAQISSANSHTNRSSQNDSTKNSFTDIRAREEFNNISTNDLTKMNENECNTFRQSIATAFSNKPLEAQNEYSNITDDSTACDIPQIIPTLIDLNNSCQGQVTDKVLGQGENPVLLNAKDATPTRQNMINIKTKILESVQNSGSSCSSFRNWLLPKDDAASVKSATQTTDLDDTLVDNRADCAIGQGNTVHTEENDNGNSVGGDMLHKQALSEQNTHINGTDNLVANWIQNQSFDANLDSESSRQGCDSLTTGGAIRETMATSNENHFKNITPSVEIDLQNHGSSLSCDKKMSEPKEDYEWSDSGSCTSVSDCTLNDYRVHEDNTASATPQSSQAQHENSESLLGFVKASLDEIGQNDTDSASIRSGLSSTVTDRGIKIKGLLGLQPNIESKNDLHVSNDSFGENVKVNMSEQTGNLYRTTDYYSERNALMAKQESSYSPQIKTKFINLEGNETKPKSMTNFTEDCSNQSAASTSSKRKGRTEKNVSTKSDLNSPLSYKNVLQTQILNQQAYSPISQVSENTMSESEKIHTSNVLNSEGLWQGPRYPCIQQTSEHYNSTKTKENLTSFNSTEKITPFFQTTQQYQIHPQNYEQTQNQGAFPIHGHYQNNGHFQNYVNYQNPSQYQTNVPIGGSVHSPGYNRNVQNQQQSAYSAANDANNFEKSTCNQNYVQYNSHNSVRHHNTISAASSKSIVMSPGQQLRSKVNQSDSQFVFDGLQTNSSYDEFPSYQTNNGQYVLNSAPFMSHGNNVQTNMNNETTKPHFLSETSNFLIHQNTKTDKTSRSSMNSIQNQYPSSNGYYSATQHFHHAEQSESSQTYQNLSTIRLTDIAEDTSNSANMTAATSAKKTKQSKKSAVKKPRVNSKSKKSVEEVKDSKLQTVNAKLSIPIGSQPLNSRVSSPSVTSQNQSQLSASQPHLSQPYNVPQHTSVPSLNVGTANNQYIPNYSSAISNTQHGLCSPSVIPGYVPHSSTAVPIHNVFMPSHVSQNIVNQSATFNQNQSNMNNISCATANVESYNQSNYQAQQQQYQQQMALQQQFQQQQQSQPQNQQYFQQQLHQSSMYNAVHIGDTKLKLRKVVPMVSEQKNDLMDFWNVRKAGDCRLVFSTNVGGKRKAEEETPLKLDSVGYCHSPMDNNSVDTQQSTKRRRCLVY